MTPMRKRMYRRRSASARALIAGTAITAALTTLGAVGTEPPAGSTTELSIHVRSNRADLVSGGDALVEVTLPAGADVADLTVRIGLREVTDAFAPRQDGRIMGLLDGLEVGENDVAAVLSDGRAARLTITNHPIGGPVFAGPQVRPWLCETERYGLGPPTDEQCNTPLRYEFHYKSSVTGQFGPYDPHHPPPDVATTTTDTGATVPYIVRVEIGVMDRGPYHIGVLYDPNEPWEPWAPQPGFNGKAYVQFGGDCAPRHRQGSPRGVWEAETPALHDLALSRGFAVMNSSLNRQGNNCNPVVSAEALMMLKEHFIERYGPIRYTMGWGCSGGAIQQHMIGANYPGLLDGIIPICSIPDMAVHPFEDCHLMQRVFDEVSPHLWADQQQQAFAAGFATVTTCRIWQQLATVYLDPAEAAGCLSGPFTFEPEGLGLEQPDWVYDAESNPDGARCTTQDYAVSVWGRRPPDDWMGPERRIGRGFANRAFDNVGVQYGLKALRAGLILPEQFVDLNEKIGGVDIDHHHQPERSSADPMALEVAYRSGLIVDATALGRVPIIDVRAPGYADLHPNAYSYVVRARLDQANGHHRNHIMFLEPGPVFAGEASMRIAFDVMDRWLEAIEADTRAIPLEEKVVGNKPPDAVDTCFVNAEAVAHGEDCHALYPPFADPRLTAGAPPTNEVIACRLRPLDRDDDYGPLGFTDEQWTRLQAAFPAGVCDYSRAGVGKQPAVPWLDYSAGPGGVPLGPSPASVPITVD